MAVPDSTPITSGREPSSKPVGTTVRNHVRDGVDAPVPSILGPDHTIGYADDRYESRATPQPTHRLLEFDRIPIVFTSCYPRVSTTPTSRVGVSASTTDEDRNDETAPQVLFTNLKFTTRRIEDNCKRSPLTPCSACSDSVSGPDRNSQCHAIEMADTATDPTVLTPGRTDRGSSRRPTSPRNRERIAPRHPHRRRFPRSLGAGSSTQR